MDPTSKFVEEKEKAYPEATMFGNLPAYGMYIRHADNISMSNVEFHLYSMDKRPPLHIDDINYGRFTNLTADVDGSGEFVTGKNIRDSAEATLASVASILSTMDNSVPYSTLRTISLAG